MGGFVRDAAGGILGLLDLLDEHWEAIDYDLLTLGLDLGDLGTGRLDWRRLRAVVTNLPRTSALAKAVHGEKVEWDTVEHLLAATVDALRAGNWQRGGGKGKRPKPLPRPGDKAKRDGRTLGTASLSTDELDELLARPRRAVTPSGPVATICTEGGCGRPRKARGLCQRHYQRWWRANR